MGYIYKVINSINNKVYIGQTTRTIPIRWSEHVRYSANKNLNYTSELYYAIQKYGAESFVVEQIEECNDNMLDEREQYWIDKYDSCNNGYNITRGGQGAIRTDYKKIIDLWSLGLPVKSIAEELGVSKQVVAKRLKYNGITVHEILSRGNKAVARHKRVVRISEDGKESVVYNSLAEASRENNLTTGQISMVCCGYRNYAGGYRWKYLDEIDVNNDFEPALKQYHYKKQVHQYTLDGKYICSFDSISEAARSFGKTSVRTIRYACGSSKRTGYGFRWSFDKFDVLPEYVDLISQIA